MTFQNTIIRVQNEAFYFNRQLLSAILNEGLETIGSTRASTAHLAVVVFTCSLLEHVAFPATLRVLGTGPFATARS